MSYMNYEERLEVAKRLYELSNTEQKTALECIFPELRESEDEKIRKTLKHYLEVKRCQTQSDEEYINCNNFLAWLEKQGEQKPSTEVKPKFKVGDWVVYCGKTCKITRLHNGIFTITNQDGSYFFNQVESTMEPIFHLWTIQDAKNGDVLCSNQMIILFKQWEYNAGYNFVIAHAGIDISGKLQITDSHWLISNESKPATKEQRDQLEKAMADAGYTFDFEKKELKEIEQKPQRMVSEEAKETMYDKPAWSEEDETALGDALWCCKQAASIAKDENDMGNIWYAEKWLKSLRPQNTWKPSDKQMHAFEQVYDWYNNNFAPSETLTSLYKDLEKLKGE